MVQVKTGLSILLRLVVAVGGGYAVAAGLAALAAVALPAAGLMVRSEAVVDRRLARLCLVMASAGIASWGGAWGLSRLAVGG